MPHISSGANLCHLMHSVSKLSTQPLALVPILSRCYALASSCCLSLLSIVQAYASWLPEIGLYENLTYALHAACSYHIKLQHQEYTNNVQIIIVTRKFQLKTSTCRDGTLKNQVSNIGKTQYFYTIPAPCSSLPTMPCVCCLFAQKGCLRHGRLWNEQY